jgi:hypothetical protein
MKARGPVPRTEDQRQKRRDTVRACRPRPREAVSETLIKALCSLRPQVARLQTEHLFHLAYLVRLCLWPPHARRHRDYSDSCSIHSEALYARFGRGRF